MSRVTLNVLIKNINYQKLTTKNLKIMFKHLISFLKARKAMRLIDRAQKLEKDVLNFLETEPTSILVMFPINLSFNNVMATSMAMIEEEKKKIDELKKENEEKKEE